MRSEILRILASEEKKTHPLMLDLKRKETVVDTETAITDKVVETTVVVAATVDKVAVAATETAKTEVGPEVGTAVAVAVAAVAASAVVQRSRLLLKAKLFKLTPTISDSRLQLEPTRSTSTR
jgi:hypothetical protein